MVTYEPSLTTDNTRTRGGTGVVQTTIDGQVQEQTEWKFANSLSNMSTTPLWFIDLENLTTTGKTGCGSDYSATFKLMDYFYF